jgi:hypothetical protein
LFRQLFAPSTYALGARRPFKPRGLIRRRCGASSHFHR